MSSGTAPTKTFSDFGFVTKVGEGRYRLALNTDKILYTIQDTADDSDDNLTRLGDITEDQFSATHDNSSFLSFIYKGETTNKRSVIFKDIYGSNNGYYLLSNSSYSYGDIIQTDRQAFVVCYAAGTRIRTMVGEVAVDSLRVGDFVVTGSGALRPIRWIGHRTVACRRHPQASRVMPVRIAAGAFGPGKPARDLTVSPAHALCVEADGGEVLIPAVRLINGTTVARIEVESVTYWHVELDSHDILLAEGLPAESYLDCGNRRFFANADVTDLAAIPDARPEGDLPFCRPFHEAGPLVDLVRARLEDRAEMLGWRKREDTFGGLHLVADGRTIHPDVDGLTARFVVPADARDLHLVSGTSVPAHVLPGSTDARHLGLPLAGLTLDDGLTGPRTIALDDPRLTEGFHAFGGGPRWTDGAARLPASLWAGCRSATFFLHLTLAAPALPRWVAPQAGNETRDENRRNA